MLKKLIVWGVFLAFQHGYAQKKINYESSIGVWASTNKQLPYWLRVNQFGNTPQQSPALSATLSLFSKPDSSHFFDFNYGFQIFGSLNSKSNINLSEGLISTRIGKFLLNIGRKKETYGLVDTLLSSGSIAWSNNALPIPKIQLSTNGFVDVPFTKKFISFNFLYAHGWLGNQRVNPIYFVDETTIDIKPLMYNYYIPTFLHQKTLYLKIGKPSWKINLYGGFNHQAFWGNEQKIWRGNFNLSPIDHYSRVVMGKNWLSSKVGNHFGSIDVGITIKGKKWDWFLYRQSIYDTGSLLNAFNLDALNGLSIVNKISSDNIIVLNKINIEYIYTNDQRDPKLDQWVGIGKGRNDYFNHYIYLDGWSYKGQVLGTPLAVIDRTLKDNTNKDNFKGGYIANNRIYGFHFATEGSIKSVKFIWRNTFSKNLGTYGIPFSKPRYQYSTAISALTRFNKFKGVSSSVNIGADIGNLYPSSIGIMFNLKKEGFIRF